MSPSASMSGRLSLGRSRSVSKAGEVFLRRRPTRRPGRGWPQLSYSDSSVFDTPNDRQFSTPGTQPCSPAAMRLG